MFMDECIEKKYNEVFESIYRNLMHQIESDENYKISDLEKLLESLYVDEGNDWAGRGGLKDTINAATIAACELALSEWKHELSKESLK